MFGGSPFYRSNPYLHTSYQPQYYPPYQNPRSVDLDRARALAAQRARRAQWLPDEYDQDDDYDSYQLSPRERAYLNAHRNRTLMEQEQRRREQEAEGARRRALQQQRWQQEQQEEDEVTRKRLEEERRQQQQKLQHTIPIADGNIPSPRPKSDLSPKRSTSTPIQYDEKHVEAASTLQRFFRIRQSVHAIQSLVSDFNTLRKDFTYPSTISFQDPLSPSTDVVNISALGPSSISRSSLDDIDSNLKIPKLAFNSINYHLLAYNDTLDKLLVKLDGIESWGDPEVRRRRRNVVKQIEKEQAIVDRFWKTSWLKHIEEQREWVDGDIKV